MDNHHYNWYKSCIKLADFAAVLEITSAFRTSKILIPYISPNPPTENFRTSDDNMET